MSMPETRELANTMVLNILSLTDKDAVLALSELVDDWITTAAADAETAEANLENHRSDPDLFAMHENAEAWLAQAHAARTLVDQLVHRRTGTFRS